jgi:hypothetical protein
MSWSSMLARTAVPVGAAVCAAGLMSGVAFASPAGPPPHPAPPPPPRSAPGPVDAGRCTQGHGHPVPDPRDRRARICQGGSWNGRPVR